MLKASFQGELSDTDLYVEIISADNEKQAGDYFNAFIQLMNKNKEKIKKLVIIDTSFLHRHYDTKYSNESVKTDWFKANKKYLESLQIPYAYMSYSRVVKSKFYAQHYKAVKMDYRGDENGNHVDHDFHKAVKTLADQFLHKGTLKDSIKFILDETAGYPALIELLAEELINENHTKYSQGYLDNKFTVDPNNLKMVLSYPGGFNRCISHQMAKCTLSTPINYEAISYRFRGSPSTSITASFNQNKDFEQTTHINKAKKSDYSPTFFAKSIAFNIDLIGIEPKYQAVFTLQVLEFCHKFKEEVKSNVNKPNSI